MTREQAKALLPIIQAYAEGKRIQVKYSSHESDQWMDYTGLNLNLHDETWAWRIKPEPREFWLSMENPETGHLAQVYRQPVTTSEPKQVIHVREVLD